MFIGTLHYKFQTVQIGQWHRLGSVYEIDIGIIVYLFELVNIAWPNDFFEISWWIRWIVYSFGSPCTTSLVVESQENLQVTYIRDLF